MNKEDKRGIFFGVVGVLTLIVAIIGASLAYFSINAQSDTDALIVQAASVQIVYEDGNELDVKELIPSKNDIAMATYSRWLAKELDAKGKEYQKCVDDNERVVCGVYEFTLTNNGTKPAEITARVEPTVETGEDGKPLYKQFTNLKYTLYDISEVPVNEDESVGRKGERIGTGTPVQDTQGQTVGSIAYTKFNILPTATTINGSGSTKVYRLFIWLDEAGELNNPEQGAVFKGTVYIDVAGTQNITGTVEGMNGTQEPADPEQGA